MFEQMVCYQGVGEKGGIYITGSKILCIILELTLGSIFGRGSLVISHDSIVGNLITEDSCDEVGPMVKSQRIFS
jgi:hypothetical protein